MRRPQLNPITRKRLRRFKSLKRSYFAFWALAGLYALGLLANVLANSKPLYVRFEGAAYFPILFFYPEDTFTGSGRLTRPDYKALARSEAFAPGSGNAMVFAPHPFGPNETVPASQIDVDDNVYAAFAPQRLVGSVDVRPDLTVRRGLAAAPFFDVEKDGALEGRRLDEGLPVSLDLRQALRRRFANEKPQPPYEERVERPDGLVAVVSLPPYRPRSRPPGSIRMLLREVRGERQPVSMAFDEAGQPVPPEPDIWRRLDDAGRQRVLEAVQARLDRRVPEIQAQIDGVPYEISIGREDVFYPFRPTSRHPFGLDSSGRDVLSRILYALRISMNFGLLLTAAALGFGSLAGGIQGYLGGKVDLLGQRAIEIWEALPFLYIMILMGSVFGRSFWLLLVVYGLFNWIGISYYMRGEFLKMRKQPFVEAAHCLGLPAGKIMGRHILPNALTPLVTFFPFALVSAIGALSALDYLGFGLPPPTPSWGELLAQAQEFRYAWWLVLYPSLALFIVILLGVFVGEGARAAFDPRSDSRYES